MFTTFRIYKLFFTLDILQDFDRSLDMDFVAMTQDKFSILADYTNVVTLSIAENLIDYYNVYWVDTSQIQVLDFATHLKQYKVDQTNFVFTSNPQNLLNFLQVQIVQSRR